MKAIQTILVPIDFGEPSESALAYAVDLAEQLGARIVLLNVFELPVVGFPDGVFVPTADIASRIVNASQRALSRAVDTYRTRSVAIEPLLEQGDPIEVILSTIASIEPDLVVMGTHGRRGIARALVGSVAENIVRRSSVPVVTIHERGTPAADRSTAAA